MGFANFVNDFISKMPIEDPKQAKPDTSLQDFQNTLPTLNANSPAGKGVSATYSPTSASQSGYV